MNRDLGKLSDEYADLICQAAGQVIAGKLDDHFPLYVWQTGSGTQTNMNVNEVISNRAIEIAGGERGSKTPVHPNDHVNMSQSSNDTFPTAMNIAAVEEVTRSGSSVRAPLTRRAAADGEGVGQHREDRPDAPAGCGAADARPGVLGLRRAARRRHRAHRVATKGLYELAIGGTAVGTGLNTTRSSPTARRRGSRRSPVCRSRRLATSSRHWPRPTTISSSRAVRSAPWPSSLHEDRQRRAVARLRTAGRARRAAAARERARLVDHAGQGEPHPVRGADDGLRAGPRQRHRNRDRRDRWATSSSTCSSR